MINNDLNSKFNPNAKLFSQEEADKILKELGIKEAAVKKAPSLSEKKTSAAKEKTKDQKMSVEEILRKNFIADEETKE